MADARRRRKKLLRRLRRLLASTVGAALVAGTGWMLGDASLVEGLDDRARPDPPRHSRLMQWTGESLARLSYDVPFLFRHPAIPREVCVIYLDEKNAAFVRDRRMHAELVRRLTQENARAVLFDLVFNHPSPDPGADAEFVDAMQENGRVILGAALERIEERTETAVIVKEQKVLPLPQFRKAAAGWGLVVFRPVDPDYGVRKIYTGEELRPSATWVAARQLNAPISDTPGDRAQPRWVNYYGPHDTFASISYDRALDPVGPPPGFFRDRVVFIGARPTLSSLNVQRDEFGTPYSRFSRQFSDGVEVHAAIFLNLLRGEWLTRLDARYEIFVVLWLGVVLGGLLPLFRPHIATMLGLLGIAIVLGLAYWLLGAHRTWFTWGVPVLVQTPLALGWALGMRYFLEERRRNQLRKAFGHYLSEEMADRIADADFDLSPGGEIVETTIIFTDLQGSTALSEDLGDPKKLSDILIAYFTNTAEHVLQNHGTVLRYVGDGVLAVWGAPLPEPEHAVKATFTAWRMHQASEKEVLGHKLTTRVGVHTGEVLAGNLGTASRFDYTVIGDAVNFASRLEGLNKYLSTKILVSDATARHFDGRFVTRRLGDFKVAGKDHAVGIHELLGLTAESAPMPWLEPFASGAESFCRGDLDSAERFMREALVMRGGDDGPVRFYLKKIEELRIAGLPGNWTGCLEFTSK